ncbi:hypothetical protein DOY81_014201 [Sarcophaga bullata]|nr:hypothetical protein DOY81_014201 [Sarcophaga bullata]
MLTRQLWQELAVKWPKSFWDDWIRHPEQRKNRVCIRPEISRTRTFGKVGVSKCPPYFMECLALGEIQCHLRSLGGLRLRPCPCIRTLAFVDPKLNC